MSYLFTRLPSRTMWAPTLKPVAPFSPISPRLTLMDPSRNKFWSKSQSQQAAPTLPHPPPPPSNPITVSNEEVFSTPKGSIAETLDFDKETSKNSVYGTPAVPQLQTQFSNMSCSSSNSNASEVFCTPDSTLNKEEAERLSSNIVELRNKNFNNNMSTITENVEHTSNRRRVLVKSETTCSLRNSFRDEGARGVCRSKSDYEIPLKNKGNGLSFFHSITQKSDNLLQNIGFLTPLTKRRTKSEIGKQSTPNKNTSPTNSLFKLPGSPIPFLRNSTNTNATNGQRAISLNSLRSSTNSHGADQVPHRFVAHQSINM